MNPEVPKEMSEFEGLSPEEILNLQGGDLADPNVQKTLKTLMGALESRSYLIINGPNGPIEKKKRTKMKKGYSA